MAAGAETVDTPTTTIGPEAVGVEAADDNVEDAEAAVALDDTGTDDTPMTTMGPVVDADADTDVVLAAGDDEVVELEDVAADTETVDEDVAADTETVEEDVAADTEAVDEDLAAVADGDVTVVDEEDEEPGVPPIVTVHVLTS